MFYCNNIELELELKNSLMNKRDVVTTMKNLSKSQYQDVANFFVQIIDDDKRNTYWDIDGGFEAMALLGNYFNSKLANHFIKRIEEFPNKCVLPAFNAIKEICFRSLNKDSAKEFIRILLGIRKQRKECEQKLQHDLPNFVLNIADVFIETLVDMLKFEDFTLQSIKSDECVLIFFNLLWCSNISTYAVELNEGIISFVKDKVFEIDLNKIVDNGKFFKELLFLLDRDRSKVIGLLNSNLYWQIFDEVLEFYKNFDKLQNRKILKDRLINEDKFIEEFKQLGDNKMDEIIKTFDSALIKEKEFCFCESIKLLIKSRESIDQLLNYLNENDFLNENIACIFIDEYKSNKATDKLNKWSLNSGLKSLKYLGRFFNETCARYLISRCDKLKFKCNQAYQENKEFNEALRDLRDLFEKNKQIKDYKNAINEFNLCWKQITNDKNDKIEFDSDMPNPKRTRH